jgi:Protein of unknown function (DUF2934)
MSLSINPTQLREEQIRQRAYEIYVARGAQEGNEVSDWLVAEHEFEESNEKPGPKKARAAAASR